MNATAKILVFPPDEETGDRVSSALSKEHKLGKDYLVLLSQENLQDCLLPGQFQIAVLFTPTSGLRSEADALAMSLKARNPKLFVVYFSFPKEMKDRFHGVNDLWVDSGTERLGEFYYLLFDIRAMIKAKS